MYAFFDITLERLHGTEHHTVQARTADRAAAIAEARHGGTATAVRTLPDGTSAQESRA